MKTEIFIYVGGAYHILWAVFDITWPRLFNWKEALEPLDDLHRVLLPITSRLLVVVYLGVAYISFFHASELISTDLGRAFLVFVSIYWATRAVMQVHYLGFKKANELNVEFSSYFPVVNLSNKTVSYIFFIEFLIMIALYFIPVVCGL
jgi:hypothetical protein